MSRHRALFLGGFWLLGTVWLSPVQAQVRALPPNVAPADQPLLHNAAAVQMPLPESTQQFIDMNVQAQQPPAYRPAPYTECWTWQILPDGVLYPSYLAGGREPRFASQWVYERDYGWLWDVALGGRAGILRFGTDDDVYPQGWQLGIEGAAFPRLDLEHGRELMSADFRFGIPLTFRSGRWEGKFSYYHLSSHLGDEYMVRHQTLDRINFVRDALVLGAAFRIRPELRLYTEAGWAFYTDGGSQPWEFQFGIDYISLEPTDILGAPFFAINGRLREEVDFGGNMTVQTGWHWRGRSGHLLRLGMQYFNGKSDQYQFFTQHEEQIGVGLWYDY